WATAAGLVVLLVVLGLGLTAWRGAAKPVELQEFRVSLYRGRKAKPAGDLGGFAEPVRVNDGVQVTARFAAPTYCFLIALNPDGTEHLCHPAFDGNTPDVARAVPPPAVTDMRFFPDDKGVFALDSAGLQVFVLLASTRPLPPYAQWRDRAGPIAW